MTGEKLTFPWDYMVILAGIEFLKGGLDKVRWLLWNTVQQNTTREVKVFTYNFYTECPLEPKMIGGSHKMQRIC